MKCPFDEMRYSMKKIRWNVPLSHCYHFRTVIGGYRNRKKIISRHENRYLEKVCHVRDIVMYIVPLHKIFNYTQLKEKIQLWCISNIRIYLFSNLTYIRILKCYHKFQGFDFKTVTYGTILHWKCQLSSNTEFFLKRYLK